MEVQQDGSVGRLFATKPNNPSSISECYIVGRVENFLSFHRWPHSCTHTIHKQTNKYDKVIFKDTIQRAGC